MRVLDQDTTKYVPFSAFDEVGSELLSGLSAFTVSYSRNGGALAAIASPTIVERSAGLYWLLLGEGTTLDAGDDEQAIALKIEHEGMQTWFGSVELSRAKITAGNTLTVESDGDLAKVNLLDGHTAQTGDVYPLIGTPAVDLAADIAALPQTGDLATKEQIAAETLASLNSTNVPASPTPGTYAERVSKIQTGGTVATSDEVGGVSGANLTADKVAKSRTFAIGVEGNKADNIVTLNTWSTGTVTLAVDFDGGDESNGLNPGSTILTFDAVTVTNNADATTITTSNKLVQQNKKAANFDVAAIATAGTFTVRAEVTTTDSQKLTLVGTLVVE